jgi:predicted double-glycine peptidase
MRVKDIFIKHHLAIQEGSFTCGPVTILNILRLKEDFSHSEEELTKLCDAKPGVGSSNENVVKAAKQVGLKILEEKTNSAIADIEKHIDNGAYVIVNYIHAFDGNGHYSAITDYDDRSLYFADSSLGFLRLRKEEFQKHWYNSDKTIRGWYAAVR